jgi:hypothetical protein
MRTTLDIADDVLFAAKEIARLEKKPLGQIVSELARRAFALGPEAVHGAHPTVTPQVSERVSSYGIHPLPSRGALVSNDMIDRLRDQEGV